jgi:hypothetical protein
VLMDQSSRDNILEGVRPPPGTPEDAVSRQSSRDKRVERSSEATVVKERSAISERSERTERAQCAANAATERSEVCP